MKPYALAVVLFLYCASAAAYGEFQGHFNLPQGVYTIAETEPDETKISVGNWFFYRSAGGSSLEAVLDTESAPHSFTMRTGPYASQLSLGRGNAVMGIQLDRNGGIIEFDFTLSGTGAGPYELKVESSDVTYIRSAANPTSGSTEMHFAPFGRMEIHLPVFDGTERSVTVSNFRYIPEPSPASLAVLGAAILALTRRRH